MTEKTAVDCSREHVYNLNLFVLQQDQYDLQKCNLIHILLLIYWVERDRL